MVEIRICSWSSPQWPYLIDRRLGVAENLIASKVFLILPCILNKRQGRVDIFLGPISHVDRITACLPYRRPESENFHDTHSFPIWSWLFLRGWALTR